MEELSQLPDTEAFGAIFQWVGTDMDLRDELVAQLEDLQK